MVDGAHHVHQAQLVASQFDRVDVHLDLPVLAAEGLRHGRAGHVRDLVANVELPEVVQLGFVQSLVL